MITKFLKNLAIVALSIGIPMLSSCADKEPEPTTSGSSDFVIDQQYLNISVGKAGKEIKIPVTTTLPTTKWFIDVVCDNGTWITPSRISPIRGEGAVVLNVDRNPTDNDRSATVKISTLTKSFTVNVRQWGSSELHVEGDFPVKPTGATASNFQNSPEYAPISYSYDDDVTTCYHSKWSEVNKFPVELAYKFTGNEIINYIEYVPRTGSSNGSFGEFELYIAEDANRKTYEKVGDYNFNMASNPSRVVLPEGKKPTSVKFVVHSGYGGYVSCAEMRFFRYNTESSLDRELLEVFTDLTCSELNPNVSQEQIDALDPLFRRIAVSLRDNSYNAFEKSFRIHEYNAYSNPIEWADKLMTKIYSNWDNPMGIAVKKGDKVLILVGETHGNNLSVQIVGEEAKVADGKTSLRPQRQGTFHSLRPGVNQIEADQEGQLFLMYTAVPSAETSKPIKVHVPIGQGEVCGYWSRSEHKDDAAFDNILRQTQGKHKYFCIVGDRMILYFDRSLLKNKITDAIEAWDNIITWQQNFMGIEDVRPALWNNHLAGISLQQGAGDYMWASDWVMGFVDYKISSEDIMGVKNFNKAADNAWGPAHEMGHVNQKAINWASTTESSNNLFSNYVLERFGGYSTRGRGLEYRFNSVYVNGNSWASMNSGATGAKIPTVGDEFFAEDPEVHMRMNWQLYLYFHRVLKNDKFFGGVFDYMRKQGLNETDDCGKKQLTFAEACSEISGLDLTDFFEAWGFFRDHSSQVSQYGTYKYEVTKTMIAATKQKLAQKPKPAHAFEYIEDRRNDLRKPNDFVYDRIGDLGYIETFEKNPAIAANASATLSGRTVTTKNCENAVAIEIRDNTNALRYASNYKTFTIPNSVNLQNCAVYAVRANGERVQILNRML